MENDNPIFRIKSKYSDMYTKEKAIADVILNKPDKVISSSIKELADVAGTSESSIVRFCKQLGYSGYSELKIEIAKSSYSLSGKDDERNLKDYETLGEHLYDDTIKMLQNYINTVDFKLIKKIANIIHKSKLLLIFGNNNSGNLAYYFAKKIKALGIPTILANNTIEMKENSLLFKKDTTGLFISNSGESKNVIASAKYAYENNFKTIVITKSKESTINKYSNHIVHVPFYKTSLLEYSFQTTIAIQLILLLIEAELKNLMSDSETNHINEIQTMVFSNALGEKI